LALGYHLRRKRLGVARSVAAAVAFTGVLLLLGQNLLDLGLEVPGVCIAATIVFGTLWGGEGEHRSVTSPRPGRARRALLWGAPAFMLHVALGASVAWFARHDLAIDRRAIQAALRSQPAPRDADRRALLRAQLRTVTRRHPAEPYFPLMGALVAYEEGDQSPMPWLQRSLERSLANGRAHLLLARFLARHGITHQALLELRLAVESDAQLVFQVARLATQLADRLEELERAVPLNQTAASSWEAMGMYAKGRELGAECDRRAIAIDPGRRKARERLAADLIDAREKEESCVGTDETRCASEVLAHAAVLEAQDLDVSTGARIRAQWLAATGDPDTAEKQLESACGLAKDPIACLKSRVTIAARLDAERLLAAAQALRLSACTSAAACADIHDWIGDQHMQRKEHGNALICYERAVREEETVPRLLKVAGVASTLGLRAKATSALERALKRKGGSDPEIDARLQKERELAARAIGRD
jgi:tetratricopeptide (TPR) repeat protein